MTLPGDPSNSDRREPARNEPSALQRAVAALEKMKARLEAVERAANEPIAIVGMGCRFPGGEQGPPAFWNALEHGVDAVREIPASRFALDSERPEGRWAALLNDVTTFDAAFFGISPREAETLDPQQRMLLEVTWEALEDAGQRPDLLFSSRTGVFVGICATDYQVLVGDARSGRYDAYCATGNAYSTAAGRISFALGLQGPAISVDTACSSSLVAISLACQSLRAGDANVCVAGGVNAILSPRTMAMLLEMQALSPDGRCKTLDARANGFVRGEGCGMVVLKRLSDAVRDADRIHAVIRGWAVNQDGRSTGLTTPNVLSQQAMLRQALERAKLSPADIGYIEMHGTGTSLGDPIEVEALREVLGAPRQDGSSCILGAVKTNIGHLEGAAGVAGLIKVLLALEHEEVPQNLHFKRLNPRVSLDGTPFVVPTQSIQWPRGDKPRRAGVSSFGISGTNAHIILEEAPRQEQMQAEREPSSYLLPLSAKNPDALCALARSYAEWFSETSPTPLRDIVYTASQRRMHHEHRLTAVASTREEFATILRSFAAGNAPAGVAKGRAPSQGKPGIVFVFSGQGSQWAGMGKALLDEEPVFRAKVQEIDAHVRRHAGFSLLEELSAGEDKSRLDQTEVVQPALFALQLGLMELLKSWGITPVAAIGHSVGEIAAACACGALAVEAAARLVVLRGKIMQKATGHGKMAWVAMPAEAAARAITGFEDVLSIAAINDPGSVVLSGKPEALDAIIADLERRGTVTRPLRVNYAFHSPQMEPLARELVTAIGRIETPITPSVTMYSSLTGKQIGGNALIAEYWGLNVLNTVNFANAIGAALQDGHRVFMEIGPHPVLLQNVQECAAAQRIELKTIPTLRRQGHGRRALLEAVGALHVDGAEVHWATLCPGGRVVSLPSYAWQRERYWVEQPSANRTVAPDDGARIDEHFYAIEWREISGHDSITKLERSHDTWLIFMDESGTGDSLVAQLQAQGQTCVTVRQGKQFARTGVHAYTLDVEAREGFVALLRDIFADGKRCAGIVYLFTASTALANRSSAATIIEAQAAGFLGIVYLLQAVLGHMQEKPRLWIVTRGVVSVSGEPMAVPVHAPVWGLGRTIDLEHPELQCTRIDLEPRIADSDGESLHREIAQRGAEVQIALRQEKRYAARIVPTRIEKPSAARLSFHADATYVITGGLGGLGLSIAAWMAQAGARHLVLVGRNAPSENARDAIRQMETSTGARVVVRHADVAQYADMARVFATLADELPPVRGIVHAAGVVEKPVPIIDIRRETFERMATSKVSGTWNLHSLTKDLELDFLILYSSASAMLGLVGQASYAGANAFMDAMATWQAPRGSRYMSIQWGAFASTGMVRDGDVRERLAAGGMIALTPEDGLMALARLLQRPRSNIAVMALSISHLARVFPHITKLQYFRELLPANDQAPAVASPSSSTGILHELAAAGADQKLEILEDHMLRRVGEILRMDPSRIDRLAPFSALGMDSLMSVELRNRLQSDLNLTLPATLLFAHPTPAALVAHVFECLGLSEKPEPAVPAASEQRVAKGHVDVQQSPRPAPPSTPVTTPTHAAIASTPLAQAKKAAAEANQPSANDVEARLAAKLAALDKFLDDE